MSSEAAESLEVGDYYIATLPLSDVSPHPDNPRIHTREDIEKLKAFISDVGVIKISMGIQESRKRLYAGHAFHQALTELDYESEKFVVKDMTDEETLIAMVGDNRIGDLSKDNPVILKSIAVNLVKMGVDLKRMQYTMKEINAMQPRREVVEDDPPETQERVITQMGDLWHLGKHRVLCGDSTKAEAVERVMGGEKADMILADLPYGTTQNKWDSVLPLEPLWKEYKSIAKATAAFVFTACEPFTAMLIMSNPEGFKYKWVWDKGSPSGHLNAHKRPMVRVEDVCVFYSEQCTYNPQGLKWNPRIVKRDTGTQGSESYGEHGSISEVTWSNHPTDLLSIPGAHGLHPTQKPVELFGYFIKTYSNEGETIVDNCLGSGTTLIAADQLDRICYGIEIAPKYCDVIVRRYINHSRFDAAGVSVERKGKTLSWEEAERKAKLPKVI